MKPTTLALTFGFAAGFLLGTAFGARADAVSEPPRDPRIFGDHPRVHFVQPCPPGYSVGTYPQGRNPQDFCGGEETKDEPREDPPHKTPHEPETHPSPSLGNPGNDKPVGRAGEKPDKGMAEQGPVADLDAPRARTRPILTTAPPISPVHGDCGHHCGAEFMTEIVITNEITGGRACGASCRRF